MDDQLPVGAVYHLTDKPSRRKRHPIGFQPPGGEMTPYRDRLNAGEYDAKEKPKTAQAAPKKTEKKK